MAILKVKDQEGNIIDIPAIRGEDGKTAYESAQEGGYTDTETNFYADLAAIQGLANALSEI